MNSFIITREHAEDLIDAYINYCIKDKLVPPIVGGVIDMESFRSENELEIAELKGMQKIMVPLDNVEILRGLATWSCWKKGATMEDTEFFLTFEIHPGLILVEGDIQFPMHKTLSQAAELIEHGGRPSTEILDDDTLNLTRDRTINRGNNTTNSPLGTALSYIKAFKDSGPRDQQETLNRFEFGIFETERVADEVDRFLNQYNTHGMKYIRYFFGFDPTKKENKIRVILAGVKEDGSNIFPPEGKTVDELQQSDDPIMLQNSWPPKGDGS